MGAEDGFQEVATQDRFGIADRGEIGALIPSQEEFEVGGELVGYGLSERGEVGYVEEIFEVLTVSQAGCGKMTGFRWIDQR